MRLVTGLVAASAAGMALAACVADRGTTGAPVAGAASAIAEVRDAAGVPIGRAMATEVNRALRVSIDVHGLTPGLHGLHLHAIGRCDPPDFASAGGHWNPTARRDGSLNALGPHEGDLPNLIVGRDGRGTLAATIPGATLATLLDADGAAIVVHAAPDDLMTDPAGNSGARVACGVFAPA